MTRQEKEEEGEGGPFALTATDFIKFLLFNYFPKNKAIFVSSFSFVNVI
jgi:hypothetical protein